MVYPSGVNYFRMDFVKVSGLSVESFLICLVSNTPSA